MTKKTFEEIKELLETKKELNRKERLLFQFYRKNKECVYLVTLSPENNIDQLERLNHEEISTLRCYIDKQMDEIKERLKELGYYD